MNKREYEVVQERWRELCQKVLARCPEPQEWQQWFNYSFVEVCEGDDTVPVYGIVNRRISRGVSFFFQEPLGGERSPDFYIKSDSTGKELSYLSIVCSLRDSDLERAERVLVLWICSDTTLAIIGDMIDRENGLSNEDLARRRMAIEDQRRFDAAN
jgi:hypothetical protein